VAERCGEPGPYATHCTEPPLHGFSCYDAGDDSSWNSGWWDGTDPPHACDDPTCPGNRAADSPTVRETQDGTIRVTVPLPTVEDVYVAARDEAGNDGWQYVGRTTDNRAVFLAPVGTPPAELAFVPPAAWVGPEPPGGWSFTLEPKPGSRFPGPFPWPAPPERLP